MQQVTDMDFDFAQALKKFFPNKTIAEIDEIFTESIDTNTTFCCNRIVSILTSCIDLKKFVEFVQDEVPNTFNHFMVEDFGGEQSKAGLQLARAFMFITIALMNINETKTEELKNFVFELDC